jgi:hypothetical protein
MRGVDCCNAVMPAFGTFRPNVSSRADNDLEGHSLKSIRPETALDVKAGEDSRTPMARLASIRPSNVDGSLPFSLPSQAQTQRRSFGQSWEQ